MGLLGDNLRASAFEADALEASRESCRAELQAAREEIDRLTAELDALKPQAKPIVRGMFSRDGVPPEGSPLRTATVKIDWDDIEPVQGQRSLEPVLAVLDLADARGLDGVRLRPVLGSMVRGGERRGCPEWALNLGDGPIPFVETQADPDIHTEIPDVWDAEWQAAARDLYAFLGQIDDDPRVAAIFATAGGTFYQEFFIRNISSTANRQAFLAAGYTQEGDKALLRESIAMTADAFPRTPIGVAYNPWQFINPDGSAGSSVGFMAEMMDHHIALCGERTILQNNSIRSDYITDPPPFYAEFVARPDVAHQFQAAGAVRVGDEEATIRWAHEVLGASGVEFSGTLDDATYAELDALLKE